MKQSKKSQTRLADNGSKDVIVMPENYFKKKRDSKSQNINKETSDRHEFERKDQDSNHNKSSEEMISPEYTKTSNKASIRNQLSDDNSIA
jgi:hypothetical protein